ncbi:MAG: cation-transporting P-type ATPase [Cystobacterineae bacterium]|nr:cation-transporting P-type ATPase [Cystobacterineae bacterium]
MKERYVHSHAPWFAKDAKVVLEKLKTEPDVGLSATQLAERLEEFGPNALPAAKAKPAFIRFLKHFHDVLIYILFVCAFVTLILGHYVDTAVILVVVLVNAAIGYFQQNKAEKALNDIRSLLSLRASVIRDGIRMDVDAAGLTLGDIVYLSPGDKVPADLRLFRTEHLRVEESALTGEALPSEKQPLPLPPETLLGDRSNMAYCGTTVSAGTGYGVVVDIGMDTEIGRIRQLMAEVGDTTTPLIRQMAAFGKTVSFVIIGVAALVYLFGHFFRDYGPSELLLSTIGLAIAAIPEGLPAILSIILAIGVQNMAKRNAIVRNLPSVETLGSVSVICSDKTGTLTKNEMTVKNLVVYNAVFDVTGSGYAPTGEIRQGEGLAPMGEGSLLHRLLSCFRHCNDAALLQETQNTWTVQGDPTEGALLAVYEKAGLNPHPPPRLATLPFDSEYKYMATLSDEKGGKLLYVKGAPDRLLAMAELEMRAEGSVPLEREGWEKAVARLAAQGKRVLGAAMKYVASEQTTVAHGHLNEGLVFLGLAGIVDPPREEVVEAIAVCHAADIRVKMITGDHVDTAKAIGKELGIGDGENALTGHALDEMSEEQFYAATRKYDIFARTSPEHKLKLVKALQAHGAICAMTGDGVNDAPALRRADVGVAMGIKGTEVTKDAAEIVLADDNFSTIAAAVEEGRRVYDNLKKTILFILPTNGAESFLIIAGILFGTLIPLTPVQILWVNMVTSITLSLALAFEPAEPGIMRRAPRNAAESLLSRYFIWRIFFVSVLIGGMTLALGVWLLGLGYSEAQVRTLSLQTIVMCQAFHLFNSRSIRQPAYALHFFGNKAVFVVCGLMLLLQLAVVYLPFMNNVFGTVPLGWIEWLPPLALGTLVFFVVEVEKYIMRRLDARKAVPG